MLFAFYCNAQLKDDSLSIQKGNIKITTIIGYQPSVSDANKLNMLPKVEDTEVKPPQFNYKINTSPVPTSFAVSPITAAKMKGDLLPKLYRSIVTVGFGNYTSVMGNYKFNTTYNKKYKFGLELDHFSSAGKVKLTDREDRVPANFSTNGIYADGAKFFKNSTLNSGIGFNRKGYRLYGYNTALDTILVKDSVPKQRFLNGDFTIGLASSHNDSSKLHYNAVLGYRLTQEIEKVMENQIGLDMNFKYFQDDKSGSVLLNNRFFDIASEDSIVDSVRYVLTRFMPVLGMQSEGWKAEAGFQFASLWSKGNYHIYPHIAFDFSLADNILVPYVKLSGELESNDYRFITSENPFILSTLHVNPTSYKISFTGGVRGKFTKSMPYNVFVKYASFDDMYFYINSFNPADSLENRFDVIYDSGSMVNAHAELGLEQTENYFFLLSADYFTYSLDTLENAYHRPSLKVSLTGKYNIENKIIVTTDLFYNGARKAYNNIEPETPIELNAYFDANLGIEYRYTKILSAFLNVNNIAASKYQQFNYYPNHRFNVMLGVTYAFE